MSVQFERHRVPVWLACFPSTNRAESSVHRISAHSTLALLPTSRVAVIVSLTASTTSTKGLHVRSEIDKEHYPKGRVVTKEEMSQINLRPHEFHGDWNYTIRPNRRRAQ